MSGSASAAASSWPQFARRVEAIRPSKADINAVIMDYLLSEGYPGAASKFAKESGIDPQVSIETIEARVAIRSSIVSGDIEAAIDKINDLNPEILDTNPELHFSLLRLQLIEIIRRGDPNSKEDMMSAITFANRQLAPRAKVEPTFVENLQNAMALLIYPRDKLSPELRALLEPSQRLMIATQVNEAILKSQGSRREAQIKHLIKLRQWSEQKCREMKKPIPRKLNVCLLGDDEDEMEDGANGNTDGDAMVT